MVIPDIKILRREKRLNLPNLIGRHCLGCGYQQYLTKLKGLPLNRIGNEEQ